MQADTEEQARPADTTLPANRPRTTIDLAVAKLRTALQERSGYVIVTAESAAAAEALFAAVEPRLDTFRTVRASGPTLDPEAIVRTLWRDGEPPFPARLAMKTLIDEARRAKQPIVVAITEADAADPTRLERVRLTLEGAPDAGEIVRIALLGGPGLIDLLRQPETRAITMRIGATVNVPAPAAQPLAVIVPVNGPRRRVPSAMVGVVVAAVVLVAWAVWWPAATPQPSTAVASRDSAPLRPAPPVPAPEPVAAQPAAVVEEPEPQVAAPTKEPEPPAPDPEPAPSPAPEPAPPAPEAMVTARPTPPAPAPPGAALQVGAFLRAESAEALRRKLAPQFPEVHVSPAARGSSRFHRVRVGGFRSQHDLDVAAAMLRTAGYTPIRVRE